MFGKWLKNKGRKAKMSFCIDSNNFPECISSVLTTSHWCLKFNLSKNQAQELSSWTKWSFVISIHLCECKWLVNQMLCQCFQWKKVIKSHSSIPQSFKLWVSLKHMHNTVHLWWGTERVDWKNWAFYFQILNFFKQTKQTFQHIKLKFIRH